MNRAERRKEEAERRHALDRANKQMQLEVRRLYTRFESETHEEIKTSELNISCRKGCAHCCEQAVVVSIFEARFIVANNRSTVLQVLDELRAQEALDKELTRSLGIQHTLEAGTNECHGYLADFADRWFDLRKPCAFLDPRTKFCRIYEDRPLACRAHFVVEEPPERCAERPEPGAPRIQINGLMPRAMLRASEHVADLSRYTNDVMFNGHLPMMVLYALEGGSSATSGASCDSE